MISKQRKKTIIKRKESSSSKSRRIVYLSGKILNTKDLTEDQKYFMHKRIQKRTIKDKPLYIFDLSNVTSKYIGETEKILEKIFERAKKMEGILFFDEADALFGKRSKVKDSHDRYANLETNYLLKKIEKHKGITFVSSNFTKQITKQSILKLDYIICLPIKKRKK